MVNIFCGEILKSNRSYWEKKIYENKQAERGGCRSITNRLMSDNCTDDQTKYSSFSANVFIHTLKL